MSRPSLLRERGSAAANNATAKSVAAVAATVAAPGSLLSKNFNISKILYFGSIFLFVVVALIAIFHGNIFGIYTIDPDTGEFTRIPVTPEMQVTAQYKKSPIPATISTTFSSVEQIGYTVGFDVYISDGTPVQNNYRIIFYNGAQTADPTLASNDSSQSNNIGKALSFIAPVNFSKSGSSLGSDSGSGPDSESGSGPDSESGSIENFQNSTKIDPTSMSSIQTALFANSTNICVFMAPDTNDMYLTYFVGHITPGKMGSSGTMNPDIETLDGWNISKPIKNIPIAKPFRVSLVVDSQFIETYINGNLVLTTKTFIPGQTSSLHSYNSSTNYNFYGPPDVMYLKGFKVANINYWDTILPSKAIRVFSSNPAAASIFTS